MRRYACFYKQNLQIYLGASSRAYSYGIISQWVGECLDFHVFGRSERANLQ